MPSIVMEPLARRITESLAIPTIGIGAGDACSGQVLVFHDLLGFMQHPHHAKVTPKFSKQYAQVGAAIHTALLEFRREVEGRAFPDAKHSPYKIDAPQLDELARALRADGLAASADAAEAAGSSAEQ